MGQDGGFQRVVERADIVETRRRLRHSDIQQRLEIDERPQLLVFAQLFQCNNLRRQRVRLSGMEPQARLAGGKRFLWPAHIHQRAAQIGVGVRVSRRKLRRALQRFNRFLGAVQHIERHAVQVKGFGIAGVGGANAVQRIGQILIAIGVFGGFGKPREDVAVTRRVLERLAVTIECAVEITAGFQDGTEIDPIVQRVPVLGNGPLKPFDGIPGVAALAGEDAVQVEGGRVIRFLPQDAAVKAVGGAEFARLVRGFRFRECGFDRG